MKFFFFNDTATTEIYTLSLHDALPISRAGHLLIPLGRECVVPAAPEYHGGIRPRDRKSTRLNSSHSQISYAVFCLKKKLADRIDVPDRERDDVCQLLLVLHDLVLLRVS